MAGEEKLYIAKRVAQSSFGASPSTLAKVDPAPPTPNGITVRREAQPGGNKEGSVERGAFELARRRFSWGGVALAAFGIALVAVGAKLFRNALGGASITAYLPVLLFAALGCWLAYLGLLESINRTIVTIASGKLTVTEGPIGRPQPIEINVRSIRQLVVVERPDEDNGAPTFHVLVLVEGGDPVVIFRSLTDREQGFFIERMIEEHLAIAPQPVEGPFIVR